MTIASRYRLDVHTGDALIVVNGEFHGHWRRVDTGDKQDAFTVVRRLIDEWTATYNDPQEGP